MLDRLTVPAREALLRSERHALSLGTDGITAAHLLLALLDDEQGTPVALLRELGISPRAVADDVRAASPPGRPQGHRVPFTPGAKAALVAAAQEAQALQHGYAGAEHLLLGVLRTAEPAAGAVLLALGADLDAARRAARHLSRDPDPHAWPFARRLRRRPASG